MTAGALAGLAAGASVLAGSKPQLTEALVPAIVVLTALATILAGDSFRRLSATDRDQAVEGRTPSGREQRAVAVKPVVPAMLPVRPDTFRGRESELGELREWRVKARSADGDPHSPPVGALFIMIHGRPGVGKSALAIEYAHRIAAEYPGGQLYGNLDNAGNPRSPAELLKMFLRELGWTQALPTDTEGLSALFRSLLEKRRRILVVLDAAPGADQVLPFVPTVPDCTVIVTSRRDLRPAISARARPLHLDVPPAAEAAEIVRTFTQADVDDHYLCVAELVYLCAHHPLALRSACEWAAEHPHGLCGVVDELRVEHRRLDRLKFRGRDVRREFEIEYERLTEEQKSALRLLALVRSRTFLPWVLQPLMNVPHDEAENLIAGLYSAQLLDVATGAVPSGLARYQFHPLVLLFVREQLARSVPEAEQEEARGRLRAAYLEGIELVVFGDEARGRDGVRPRAGTGTIRRYIHDVAWLENVRNAPDEWVRAEHPNLVESIFAAVDDPALCWRIAQWLGDCVPYDSDHAACLAAFTVAREAAEQDGSEYGAAAVAVAQGGYLVGIERYEEGIATLRSAGAAAQACGPGDEPRLLALRARRRIGEAYLQMGAYGKAALYLDADLGDDDPEPIQRELGLIKLLRAEALAASDAQQALEEEPFHDALTDFDDDYITYRVHLNLALVQHRRRDWHAATHHLQQAAALHGVDARRAASVIYRTARLWLSRALCPGTDSLEYARRAASHAADAVITFQRIGNPVGAIRARCLLVRALVVAGDLVQADDQLQRCRTAQRDLRGAGGDATALIGARIRRAAGELALARNDHRSALSKLRGAAQIFEANGDAGSTAEVLRQSARAYRQVGTPQDEVNMLWSAAGHYYLAGDYVTLHEISVELTAATRKFA